MQSDIWVKHEENLAIEVTGFSGEGEPWYTVTLGEWNQGIKLYMTHAQLVELVGKATNTIMTTVPTEDFFRAGPIEATYEPTDKGVAALSLDNCPTCGKRIYDFAENGQEAENGQRSCIEHDDQNSRYATMVENGHCDQ